MTRNEFGPGSAASIPWGIDRKKLTFLNSGHTG